MVDFGHSSDTESLDSDEEVSIYYVLLSFFDKMDLHIIIMIFKRSMFEFSIR